MGSVMGNLECWLLLRSLYTLEIRVRQQSKTATEFVTWLNKREDKCLQSSIKCIWHASIPSHPSHSFHTENFITYPAMFSIEFSTEEIARDMVTRTRIFKNATSFGGVESLIEWRARFDSKVPKELVRVSIGLEPLDTLKRDFLQALQTTL